MKKALSVHRSLLFCIDLLMMNDRPIFVVEIRRFPSFHVLARIDKNQNRYRPEWLNRVFLNGGVEESESSEC